MKTIRLLAVFLCVLAAPPLTAQKNPQPPALTSAPVLKPGDVVKVVVWRSPELSGDFAVGAKGELIHPLYQAVFVAGIPIDSVEPRVRQFLSTYSANPQIVVQPLFRVVVNGEIRTPNQYLMPGETTIGGAVAIAGGPTERSNLPDTRLVRDGQVVHIDLTDPSSQWANSPIHSGDIILVGRTSNFWLTVFVPIVTTIAAVASVYSIVHSSVTH